MSLTCYYSPRCPFARRALIALKEKNVEFEAVVIPLNGELKKAKENGNFAEWGPAFAGFVKEFEGKSSADLLKIKEDYKKTVNASGEVPTLVYNGTPIAEADVCAEFISDNFPDQGTSLMPSDPVLRSKVRHYLKVLGGPGGVSGMYGFLMNQDPEQDAPKRDKVYGAFEKFVSMADKEGPYFLGKELSLADVLLMPMYDQFRFAWPHYRGVELIPTDTAAYPWAARMQAWAAAVEERDSFKAFSQGEHYISIYATYAGARGVSKME